MAWGRHKIWPGASTGHALVRASLAFYNTFDEIDRLAIAVARLARQRQMA